MRNGQASLVGYAISVARHSLISLLIFSTAYKANMSPHTTTLSMAGVLPESAGGTRIIPKCTMMSVKNAYDSRWIFFHEEAFIFAFTKVQDVMPRTASKRTRITEIVRERIKFPEASENCNCGELPSWAR